MSPVFSRKLDRFGTSIFSTMTELAVRHGSINLGQGVPDSPPPAFILEAAKRHLIEGPNQYAPSHGVADLREMIAKTQQRLYGLSFDPNHEITVTCGATQAIHAAINGLCDPGDRVVVVEPAYDSYVPSAVMAGAEIVTVSLRPPDYRFDPEELERAFSSSPRLLLLNTPHNPTTRVLEKNELELLANHCRKADTIAISDEVYEHLTFDGRPHIPFASLAGMAERTITISSVSKTFGVTGWRIGWACGPKELIAALRRCHQFVTFAAPTPLQLASAQALSEAEDNGYYQRFRDEFVSLRESLTVGLDGTGLKPLPAEGTYFLLADYGDLSQIPDILFCERMTTELGITAIPMSPFYGNPRPETIIRFCFAREPSTLELALEKLASLKTMAPSWS